MHMRTHMLQGEILIRSASNFSGYYKAQDKTDEVLEKDGWFHTGVWPWAQAGLMRVLGQTKWKQGETEYKVKAWLMKDQHPAPSLALCTCHWLRIESNGLTQACLWIRRRAKVQILSQKARALIALRTYLRTVCRWHWLPDQVRWRAHHRQEEEHFQTRPR